MRLSTRKGFRSLLIVLCAIVLFSLVSSLFGRITVIHCEHQRELRAAVTARDIGLIEHADFRNVSQTARDKSPIDHADFRNVSKAARDISPIEHVDLRNLSQTARDTGQSDNEALVDLSNDLVDSMIMLLEEQSMFRDNFWELRYKETRDALRYNLTGAKHLDKTVGTSLNGTISRSWANFARNINEYCLYDWDDGNITEVLKDMETRQPIKVEQNIAGSELKFKFIFHEGFFANGKAMRYARDMQTNPNHFVMDEFEKHIAEIAAFHLDRLLGFCRVPPTTGRRVNITEFRQLVPSEMRKDFFTSPAGNKCFYGDCVEHCNPKYAFCGQGDMIEFSLMVYVPIRIKGRLVIQNIHNPYRHEWRHTYIEPWKVKANFCDSVQRKKPYDKRATLLSLIDIHVFDFLTGNRDRHTIFYYAKFGDTYPILFDNGRGFGTSDRDYTAILAPLRQCCQIKKSTLLKLIKLYTGPDKLSALMNDSLRFDPVAPVLIPPHLNALDRRVVEVLKTVAGCIISEKRSFKKVIFEDV